MKEKTHPMQPLVWKEDVIRFKENKLVVMLLDHGRKTGMDLNYLASKTYGHSDYTNDWIQLSQLIGYSLGGFADLSYVDDKTYHKANKIADKMRKEKEGKPK